MERVLRYHDSKCFYVKGKVETSLYDPFPTNDPRHFGLPTPLMCLQYFSGVVSLGTLG